MAIPFESLSFPASSTERNSICRMLSFLLPGMYADLSLECVVLTSFNSIPMRALAAEQTADVSRIHPCRQPAS